MSGTLAIERRTQGGDAVADAAGARRPARMAPSAQHAGSPVGTRIRHAGSRCGWRRSTGTVSTKIAMFQTGRRWLPMRLS